MQLTIVSLKGIAYEGVAKSFTVQTETGEITILDRHRPLISLLKKGVARIVESNENQIEIPIASGFLEVTPDNAVDVLVD